MKFNICYGGLFNKKHGGRPKSISSGLIVKSNESSKLSNEIWSGHSSLAIIDMATMRIFGAISAKFNKIGNSTNENDAEKWMLNSCC
jgi:hypothetical protein